MPAKDEDVTMIESSGVSSPKELRNALYARCASFEEGHVFNQDELFAFGIIPENSIEQLLVYTRQLAKDGLFKLMSNKDGRACWKVVRRADAAKYRSLSQEEALVYSYIEGAAREGIWSKVLRFKTNLHMTTLNRAVKSLESKSIIKPVNNIKHPNRKTYMMANLQPSENMTGGPFYTDEGELDHEFIHQMSRWADRYILARSWAHPPLPEPEMRSSSRMAQEEAEGNPSPSERKETKMTQQQAEEEPPLPEPRKGSGSKTTQEQEEDHPQPPEEHKKKPSWRMTKEQAEELRAAKFRKPGPVRDRTKDMIPMHPDHRFPTLSEVTRAINASGVSNLGMRRSDMEQLLDILCWDGRLEKTRDGKAYKAVKQVHGENGVSLGNGLTEVPCGRCPVFDDCEEGGPVNAKSCEYFKEWLESLDF